MRIPCNAIEKGEHVLAPPDTDRLQRDLQIVKNLYERSYAWAPATLEIGEQRFGKTMREYIKSWITDWDIQRLYGDKDVIITEPTTPDDLTEDTAFETLAQEPPEEEV